MVRGLGTFARGFAVALLAAGVASSPLAAQDGPSAAGPRPPKLPTELFARADLMAQPLLSPDGEKILTRLFSNGKEMLGVVTLATGVFKLFAKPDEGDISWYRWAGNGRILISFASTVSYFGEDAQMTRLVTVELATGKATFIGDKEEGLEGDDVLYVDPSGEWLLLSFQRSASDYPSVFRIELATNRMKEIVRQYDRVWEWFADTSGVVRTGQGFLDNGWFLIRRKTEQDKFERVMTARFDKGEDVDLRFPNQSDDAYALSNQKTGRYAVYKYDVAKHELGELIYENPTNDVDDLELAEDGKSVKAVFYTDDRERILWFDPVMKQHQADIDNALKGRLNRVVSRSKDDKRMLVWTGASNDPGSYYVYVPEAGKMLRVARVNEKLDPRNLVASTYVKYKARDGVEIPAYLTLPKGRPATGLPLVIMPHGGPFGVRDKLEYEPDVQFLANRGYAVLQPNFRGSDSYGEKFYKLGEAQWGRAMQDDLDDGMDWLVKAGTVDPKRVCIVGGSYGGYAALWGATRNPERYRCAASFAGISDLRRQLNYQVDFLISRRYRKDWRATVQGQKDFDLDSVSPIKQISRLRVPLLLAHGDADQRVPYKQSSLYAEALTKAGKTFEFQTYKGEGHGFSAEANSKDWYDRLEAFLSKYNPAD